MKILLATPLYPPEIGGPATHAEVVAREFTKHDIEVVLLPFIKVRSLPKIIRHIAYFLLVLQKGMSVEVIYALDPVSVGLPSMWAAKILRKRLILRVPGDYAWEQGQQKYKLIMPLDEFLNTKHLPRQVRRLQQLEASVAKNASLIIVPSEYLKNVVMRWRVPAEKIKVVYSSIPIPTLLPTKEEARKALGIDGPYILSAGRLVPWKGFSGVIESVASLSKQFPGITLGIAGDGPDREILLRGAADRGVGEKVQLLGRLPHEKLLQHIIAADAFILNTNYEGLSHQLIEVMQAGTPVITTDVGGNTELITNNQEGLLVPYNDVQGIRKAAEKILKDTALRDSLVNAAKAKASSFTEEKMVAGLLPLFHNQKI